MSLPRTQSLRVAAVLEEYLDQLDVVAHALTIHISRLRCATLVKEKARVKKLRGDCQCIAHQVSKLHTELVEKQCFTSLLRVLEAEDQKRKAEHVKRDAKTEPEKRLMRLKDELQEKTKTLKEMVRRADSLRSELDAKAVQNKVNERDCELKLQRAQKETSQAEKLLDELVELVEKQLEQEVGDHEDSKKFLQSQFTDLQLKLLQYQQLTDHMLEDKKRQLGGMISRTAAKSEKLAEMIKRYRYMKDVVKADALEQERLRQQEVEARALIKLQAWWRGCMVRRGLVPLKPEEDKKGKKKGGKKK